MLLFFSWSSVARIRIQVLPSSSRSSARRSAASQRAKSLKQKSPWWNASLDCFPTIKAEFTPRYASRSEGKQHADDQRRAECDARGRAWGVPSCKRLHSSPRRWIDARRQPRGLALGIARCLGGLGRLPPVQTRSIRAARPSCCLLSKESRVDANLKRLLERLQAGDTPGVAVSNLTRCWCSCPASYNWRADTAPTQVVDTC